PVDRGAVRAPPRLLRGDQGLARLVPLLAQDHVTAQRQVQDGRLIVVRKDGPPRASEARIGFHLAPKARQVHAAHLLARIGLSRDEKTGERRVANPCGSPTRRHRCRRRSWSRRRRTTPCPTCPVSRRSPRSLKSTCPTPSRTSWLVRSRTPRPTWSGTSRSSFPTTHHRS